MPTTQRNPGSSRSTKRLRRANAGKKPYQKKSSSRIYAPITILKYPFPLRLANTLKYVEEFQLTLNGSGYGNYLFSANGMYDPNITGTGHQPLYFDKLTAIYNHYHVMKSMFKATPVRSGTATDVQLAVYIDDDTATAVTDVRTAAERPGSKFVHAWPSQGRTPTAVVFWNGQYTFGGNIVDNSDLKGTGSANPSEQSYFVVNCQGGAGDVINVVVEIEYTAVWSELKSEAEN